MPRVYVYARLRVRSIDYSAYEELRCFGEHGRFLRGNVYRKYGLRTNDILHLLTTSLCGSFLLHDLLNGSSQEERKKGRVGRGAFPTEMHEER